jgi:hypothetical protein
MGDAAKAVPTTAALLMKVLLEIFLMMGPFLYSPPPCPPRQVRGERRKNELINKIRFPRGFVKSDIADKPNPLVRAT